jgi:hypothetical protein
MFLGILLGLDFEKPFKGTNDAVGLVRNCDKMIGGQFEAGLANLKSVCQSPTN